MATAINTNASKDSLQLSRIQQIWLIIALVAVCAPIWFYLPFWIAGICLGMLGWRLHVLRKGSAQISRKITALIAVLALALVALHWRPPIGLEPMSSLLMICCALKFLEMRVIREARLVLFLCYFIASLQVIYEQTIFHFLIAMVGIILTLTAQNMSERDPWRQYSFRSFSLFPLRSIGWIALVSIPLTMVIFVFAPRLPSFWLIPVSQDQAQTGISDSMTPGAIGELARSGELAFRVGFEGEIPHRSELYWRGLVLSDYDGQTWRNRDNFITIQDGDRTHWPTNNRLSPAEWIDEVFYTGRTLRYDVYQEPNGQPWLFAIAAPRSSENGLGMTKGLRLVSRQPVTQRVKYSVVSYPDYSMTDEILDGRDRFRNLSLPPEFNPRTRALAQQWVAEGLTPEQMVRRLFFFFNEEHVYTLEPGVFGTDSIDEFLFERKRGFCEHFAEATVFFLRAAGIPARIVTGYQGGEVNPEGDYLLVYQYDAHAWAEYWQDGRGWVQIDPTAAVSPDRIELGARELLQEEEEFLADEVFSLAAMQEVDFFNWLRLNMDSINYLWVSWVLGYDNDRQLDFLQGLFGEVSYKSILIVMGSIAVLAIAGIYFFLYWVSADRKRPEAHKYFDRFRAELVSSGLELKPGYTPKKIAELSREKQLENLPRIEALCRLFERQLFGEQESSQEIKELLRSGKGTAN